MFDFWVSLWSSANAADGVFWISKPQSVCCPSCPSDPLVNTRGNGESRSGSKWERDIYELESFQQVTFDYALGMKMNIYWWIYLSNMVIFNTYVSLPEGTSHNPMNPPWNHHEIPLNHHFPMVFLWFSSLFCEDGHPWFPEELDLRMLVDKQHVETGAARFTVYCAWAVAESMGKWWFNGGSMGFYGILMGF